MKDRNGQPINVGDRVVYFDRETCDEPETCTVRALSTAKWGRKQPIARVDNGENDRSHGDDNPTGWTVSAWAERKHLTLVPA